MSDPSRRGNRSEISRGGRFWTYLAVTCIGLGTLLLLVSSGGSGEPALYRLILGRIASVVVFGVGILSGLIGSLSRWGAQNWRLAAPASLCNLLGLLVVILLGR